MAEQEHIENFQIERVAFFSDAVFAIAITLLIIEIKIPNIEYENVTDKELLNSLAKNLPKFIGFFISFFVIGLYWMAHHRMFKYVTHLDKRLLWNNIFLLLPIIFLPFSTAFFSEFYNNNLRVPLGVYSINIWVAGFFSYRLWKIIERNSLYNETHKVIFSYNSTRALVIPGIFLFAFLFSFINIWVSYLIPNLAFVATKLINRYYKRKHGPIIQTYLK